MFLGIAMEWKMVWGRTSERWRAGADVQILEGSSVASAERTEVVV